MKPLILLSFVYWEWRCSQGLKNYSCVSVPETKGVMNLPVWACIIIAREQLCGIQLKVSDLCQLT